MNIFAKLASRFGYSLRKKGWLSNNGWVNLFGGGKIYDVQSMYTGIVFKCIDLIATNVSTNKFTLYKTIDGDKVEAENHPAYKLLRRPNKFQTTADILYQISSHLDTAGRSYLYPVKNKAGNDYVELWVLNPFRIKAVPSEENFISHYEYTKPKGGKETFQIDELIEIKRPDPFNPLDGLSTITKSKYEIEGQLSAIEWNHNFFNYGAMPSGILTTDQEMDEDAFNRLDSQFREKFQGKENAHKLMVLDGGMKFESMSLKQKDMDFMEQRKFSRDEILAMFGVPKGILYADDVNRANAEAAKYFFAEHTLSPRLDLIFEKLNVFYLGKFKNIDGLEFEYVSPVPENIEYSLNRKEKAVNKWLTINEVRAEDGYEPLEGGDIFYLPISSIPSGEDTEHKPPQQIQNIIKLTKKKTATDNRYLKARRSYMTKKEIEMAKKYKAHFQFLVDEIKKHRITKAFNLKKKESAGEILAKLVPDLTDWQTLTAKITFDFGQDVLKTAIKQTGDKYDMDIDFDLENSGAIRILNKRSLQTAKDVTDTTLNQARQIIKDELQQGEVTLDKIKSRLLLELELDTGWKAERIARTELQFAYNEGAMTLYKQNTFVKKLKWLTADDEKVCPICAPNDDEIVNKGGVFKSGHSNAPAHPNCRCEVIPYFD